MAQSLGITKAEMLERLTESFSFMILVRIFRGSPRKLENALRKEQKKKR